MPPPRERPCNARKSPRGFDLLHVLTFKSAPINVQGTSKPDIPQGKSDVQELILVFRQADIAAHAVRQMGGLVRRMPAPPDGQHQGARGSPGAEFPAQFIELRAKGISNYKLFVTHDFSVPAQSSSQVLSKVEKTRGCGREDAKNRSVSRSRQVTRESANRRKSGVLVSPGTDIGSRRVRDAPKP